MSSGDMRSFHAVFFNDREALQFVAQRDQIEGGDVVGIRVVGEATFCQPSSKLAEAKLIRPQFQPDRRVARVLLARLTQKFDRLGEPVMRRERDADGFRYLRVVPPEFAGFLERFFRRGGVFFE